MGDAFLQRAIFRSEREHFVTDAGKGLEGALLFDRGKLRRMFAALGGDFCAPYLFKSWRSAAASVDHRMAESIMACQAKNRRPRPVGGRLATRASSSK